MNTQYRKPLPGTNLEYYDTREAVEAIEAGAYDKLPYTSKVLAEQLVRRCEPDMLTDALTQLVKCKRDLDFLLVSCASRCGVVMTFWTNRTVDLAVYAMHIGCQKVVSCKAVNPRLLPTPN